jgi:hypothetical protein
MQFRVVTRRWIFINFSSDGWRDPAKGREMDENTLPALRHSARGCLNAIKLCVSALELPCTHEEEMEFIDDVIRSSDKMVNVVERLEHFFAISPAPSE